MANPAITVVRTKVEVDVQRLPFREGETLWSYAERVLREAGIRGRISGLSVYVSVIDVHTFGDARLDSVLGRELLRIDYREVPSG